MVSSLSRDSTHSLANLPRSSCGSLGCISSLSCVSVASGVTASSSVILELGPGRLGDSWELTGRGVVGSDCIWLETLAVDAAETIAAALRDSSGWLVSLAVSGGSVDSKLVRCFFRTSPDVRPAALAFLFILDLGAIDKNHTFNRDLFPSHGRSFPEKFLVCACAVSLRSKKIYNVTSPHG